MAQTPTAPSPASVPAAAAATPRNEVEKPFSLAPAIFTSFAGFPSSPPDAGPLEPEQKLAKIIENLSLQHEAVRRNMLGLVEKRAESLARKAREELAALRGEGINEEVGLDRAQDEEVKKSIEEMIQRLRVPVRKDAEAGEYEVQAGNMELRNAPSTRGGDDMHKSGTDSPVVPEPKARTATAIRAELSWELRNLVDRAVSEMEAYEAHATSVSSHYKQAMERRTTRFGGTMGSGLGSGNGSVGNGGGILKNRNEESPVDREAIRRMSTGMPFTGPAVMGSVPRTFENIEGVARRGNKRGE